MSLIMVKYCSFLYDSLIVGFGTSCTMGGSYHHGINMRGSSVGHSYDLTCGLNGGLLGRSLPDELPPSESPSYPPFGGC
jgi:hypothetical protein